MEDEEEEKTAIVSTDMRIAAMGIISFIPYFNWLVCSLFVLVWFGLMKIKTFLSEETNNCALVVDSELGLRLA